MVSVVAPRSRGTGSSPERGHCVVFLGKTLKAGVQLNFIEILGSLKRD